MGRELLAEDVERAFYIFRPFVDDVEVCVGLDQATWRGTDSTTHVGDEKATIGLSTNLVRNRRQKSAVRLLELRLVWVGGVEVESGVLMVN